METRCSPLSQLALCSTGGGPTYSGLNKECLFALTRTLKVEYPKESTDKLLEIVREFSNGAEYHQISLLKLFVLLHISNNQEIRFKNIYNSKYLGVNLTKDMYSFYKDNYKA